ncbi:ABC transporter ATP-binding protein [Sediminispirochaeta bajacaliforniensis]|uniref:ABC transporter ATP-binding protein n=1 Tax=Sediminispirochaeta bajacaliforniensis TaxID=148 RepID=UPI0003685D0E|nr:ABC transporter ATP-binding protein [Sediminispirochaeta bajacaliforniensis]
MTNEVKLEIRNMTKKYKNGDGVENINLKVKTGELVTLLGPSGCGKTTILRTIGGFLECTEGSVLIDDKNIEHLPPERRPTAMVFQSYNLWPHMTVYENMEFGLKLRKIPKVERRRQIMAMMELVKITGMEKKYPGQMSGGQQQRVAIARSLLLKPDVLLLDEPFSALDAKIRSQMREELRKIQLDLNITVVFVTHDQEEAMALSDRIVVMNKGSFEQVGTPAEIYDKPINHYVADFIGDMNFIEMEDKTIAVRPEYITIVSSEAGGIAGTIRAVMILGHYSEVTLDTEYGILKSFIVGESAEQFHPGKKVSLSYSKSIEFSRRKGG